jgi:hypothetical protein
VSTINYAEDHPDEMIVKNLESDYTPLESGILEGIIPVWVIKRVLANHDVGPHSNVDILPGSTNTNYLLNASCYGGSGSLDLIMYLASRWPEQLLTKKCSMEAGGYATPFVSSLFRQRFRDERIPAFLRQATIAEKKGN